MIILSPVKCSVNMHSHRATISSPIIKGSIQVNIEQCIRDTKSLFQTLCNLQFL